MSRTTTLSLRLRQLVLAGLLAALSILCGKYLAIRGGDILRFSFENLPILLSGFVLGPLWGALTGAVADLLGCAMVGYTVNPLVTLGAVAIGLVGGILYRALGRLSLPWRVILSSLAAHIAGSILLKTWGLASYYDYPFPVLLLWRILNYLIIEILEGGLLLLLLRHKALRSALSHFEAPKKGGTQP